jgi:hypothetical protein
MKKGQENLPLAKLLTLLLFPLFFYFSCKKADVKKETGEELRDVTSAVTLSDPCNTLVCEDCTFQETIENDTSEYTTILGGTYANPYSIPNMTQAYNNIHGTHLQSVSTTHYYVKFKPQTDADFNKLDSLDLELYDYPLDKVVLQDGDYWPSAYTGLGPNEYPWLYTVVPSNFQFPAGITYQNLGSLNIPDNDGLVEDEAFNLTGNNECSGTVLSKSRPSLPDSNQSSTAKLVQPDFFQNCPDGYYWDNSLAKCLPVPDCGPGYHWNYGLLRCEQDPPPPANLQPKGMITYLTYSDFGVIPASAPVKYVRIVARRFFKIDKTFTDANGNFQLSKRFPHKVTIIVKFRTSSTSIRQFANGLGFWKAKYPMRKNIGTYKGNDLTNLIYQFQKGSTSIKRRTKRWLGCVALNTVVESSGFLSANNMMQLPNDLRIFLDQTNLQTTTSQYEFIKNTYAHLNNQLGGQINRDDILLRWLTSDINSLTASKVTIAVGKGVAVAYLYRVNAASSDNINRFTEYAQSMNYGIQIGPTPFGDGLPHATYFPQIIAMWEGFAQHFGHTIANRIYGSGEYSFVLQGKTWSSSGGISSSSKYLEGFDPSIGPPNELFKWIPVGLINDLMDNTTDPFPVVDNVSGFTYSEIQAAYYTEPLTMVDFKNALKNIKPSQAAAIDQLFVSYGY